MSDYHVLNTRSGEAVRSAMKSLASVRSRENNRMRDWSTVEPTTHFSVEADGHTYSFVDVCHEGDICDVFLGKQDDNPEVIALKVARNANDQDLVNNEARVLSYLRPLAHADPQTEKYLRYLPRLVRQITVRTEHGERHGNILAFDEAVASHSRGYVSMQEVLRAYPGGVGPKTFAWMWRRVVEILSWVHAQGVVHGAVVPGNILIHPKTHQGILLDWCYAEMTSSGSHIKAGDMKYRAFYPPEVFERHPATPAIDVFMAGKCGIALLGGDLTTHDVPEDVPSGIKLELKVCTLPNAHKRPDAYRAYANMAAALSAEYGQPHYTKFTMPERG